MTRRATAAELRAQAASMFVDDTNLLKTLDNLGGREFGRVIRSATGNAMNPVVSQARKNLKGHRLQGSGLLRKSLGKKNKTYKRAALQVALVGARTGFKQVVTRRSRWGVRSVVSNPVNYAHLVESGHRGRGRNRSGRTPGRPFLASALRSGQPLVMARLKTELGVGILRQWRKASSKCA